MNSDWELSKLHCLFELKSGYAFKSTEFTESGTPVIKIKNVKAGRLALNELSYVSEEYLSARPDKLVKQDDLLITMSGNRIDGSPETWVGKVAYFNIEGNYLVNQRIGVLRSKSTRSVDPRFFGYLLSSKVYQDAFIAIATSSGGQANLSPAQILNTHVPVPPLTEQKRIAHILGTLDDKIELNRRMNATLEATARALFKSWFVDFDSVRAKQQGRQPTGMDPATAELFPSEFEESERGLIPKGWVVESLKDKLGFLSGFSFKSSDWKESGIPVIKIGSVKPGMVDLDQVSYVSEMIANKASRYRLDTADMVVGMTGYVGQVSLIPPTKILPLLNQRVGKFILPGTGTAGLGFWYCLLIRTEFRTYVEGRSHGTAQANVSSDSILGYRFTCPPKLIVDHFNEICAPLFNRILSNHAQSCSLIRLRDLLLPELLSGKLTTADNQAVAEVST